MPDTDSERHADYAWPDFDRLHKRLNYAPTASLSEIRGFYFQDVPALMEEIHRLRLALGARNTEAELTWIEENERLKRVHIDGSHDA